MIDKIVKIHGVSNDSETEYKIRESNIQAVCSKHFRLPSKHSLLGSDAQYLVVIASGDIYETVFTTATLSPDLKDWY
jgi:hypothetical protein